MKKILLLCFINILLLANFTNDKYYQQEKILNSIDVDVKYLKDESFMGIFNEMSDRETAYFTKILNEANTRVQVVKAILKKEGIPDVFLYLAMIESNFKIDVKSGAKAVGVWQFMVPTAKNFGLKIDKYVDERKDVVASSIAAAKYIKNLKDDFGKWYLAIFAYNCGSGCVKKAISNAGSDDLAVLLDEEKKYLPGETRRFFKKILSTSLVVENDIAKYGDVYLLNQIMALNISKVDVKANSSLASVASRAGMSLDEFKELNPFFKGNVTPPYSYHVYLPIDKIALYKDNSNPKMYAKNDIKNVKSYRVKKGDTLYVIAKNNGISTKILKSYNNLKDDRLGINQTLLIPILVVDDNKEAKN
ncbi:lytic transglycosylase domain-containing protein [Campylobacter sp. MG1]|uniref:lytic transglycosylase domain-containing protein n=1 Tax=Campylobacter sp. MG1 TaxID=2976332 RepID=UPI00226CBDFA|nr:lytic transglycosylase domain-containing protein [Campylobacter sp. MG1]